MKVSFVPIRPTYTLFGIRESSSWCWTVRAQLCPPSSCKIVHPASEIHGRKVILLRGPTKATKLLHT